MFSYSPVFIVVRLSSFFCLFRSLHFCRWLTVLPKPSLVYLLFSVLPPAFFTVGSAHEDLSLIAVVACGHGTVPLYCGRSTSARNSDALDGHQSKKKRLNVVTYTYTEMLSSMTIKVKKAA